MDRAVASIWIQCSNGATYAFGIYSPILKSTQAYDQSTLDTVSVFKDIGANAGVLSGLLYAAVVSGRGHSRLSGPWVVHVARGVLVHVARSHRNRSPAARGRSCSSPLTLRRFSIRLTSSLHSIISPTTVVPLSVL